MNSERRWLLRYSHVLGCPHALAVHPGPAQVQGLEARIKLSHKMGGSPSAQRPVNAQAKPISYCRVGAGGHAPGGRGLC